MIEVACLSACEYEIIVRVLPQVQVCVSLFEACGELPSMSFLEKSISSDV